MAEERPDRRSSDPEASARALGADRRDSPRLLMPIEIRAGQGEPFATCEGDISLGGAYYTADAPPLPDLVEVRFSLPAAADGSTSAELVQVCCKASVVRSHREDSGRWGVHLSFRDMTFEDEQALARFLDAHLCRKRAGG